MKRGAVILVVIFGSAPRWEFSPTAFFGIVFRLPIGCERSFSQRKTVCSESSHSTRNRARVQADVRPNSQADSPLSGLIDSSRIVTQEIREALVETDRVRSECRLKMLEHFYEIAAAMPKKGARNIWTWFCLWCSSPERWTHRTEPSRPISLDTSKPA